jgi:hypothetical protein
MTGKCAEVSAAIVATAPSRAMRSSSFRSEPKRSATCCRTCKISAINILPRSARPILLIRRSISSSRRVSGPVERIDRAPRGYRQRYAGSEVIHGELLPFAQARAVSAPARASSPGRGYRHYLRLAALAAPSHCHDRYVGTASGGLVQIEDRGVIARTVGDAA